MTQDSIEREVTIEAPVERVWSVITEAEHLGRWFGDAGAEIDLRPGGELTMRWESGDTARARVEAVEPPRRFAYRWFHYSHVDDGGEHTPGNSTVVEFTLTPEGRATRLRVVESGFSTLDASDGVKRADFEGNTRGWKHELGELVVYAEKVAA
jgi:uncharacterized protein YndB with AHSA1/START domain